MATSLGLAACLVAHPVSAQTLKAAPVSAADVAPSAVTGFIVKYKSAATASATSAGISSTLTPARQQRLTAFGARNGLTLRFESFNALTHLRLGAGRTLARSEAERLAQALQADQPDLEWAVADVQVPLAYVPNDYYWPLQWPLSNSTSGINMPGAWDLYAVRRSSSDPNLPIVAIIDSGYRRHVDMPVPEFGPNTYNGAQSPLDTGDSFLKGECPNDPDASLAFNSWHGLKIQGQIAATTSNGIGIAGVDGQLKILQARYYGKCGGSLSAYIDAIIGSTSYRSTSGQRVRVMNLSQGGMGGACYAPLQDAISNAINAGITIIASAGNNATDASNSPPGNCAGVVAVAATNVNGARSYYSNFGATVALAAPGGEYTGNASTLIPSTAYPLDSGQATVDDVSTNYQQIQGTSFAAPHVAAVAGMMLNINPTLTPVQVKAKLLAAARPFPGACPGCGAGIVDARAALVAVMATVNQVIAFAKPADQGLGQGSFIPAASASSGLPVSLSVSTPAVCSIDGAAIRLLALGTCTLTATQPGDATYFAATPVMRSFQINAGSAGADGGSNFDAPTLPQWGMAAAVALLTTQWARRRRLGAGA